LYELSGLNFKYESSFRERLEKRKRPGINITADNAVNPSP